MHQQLFILSRFNLFVERAEPDCGWMKNFEFKFRFESDECMGVFVTMRSKQTGSKLKLHFPRSIHDSSSSRTARG